MQAIMPLQRRRTNMKITFNHSVVPAIALAFAISTPASAQLLGGSGGLGGGLTGGLGGSIERTTGGITGSTTGTLRGEKQVDRKSGRVRGSGSAESSSNGSITGGTTVLDRSVNGSSNGSASASKSGSVDAQLIGTDAVRGVAQDGVARGRGAVNTVRGTAGSAVGAARNAAGNAVGTASGAGSIAGSGSGMAQGMAGGSLGQLVASGSAAANGAGNFSVEPGMPIEDAKGRTIGYVQSVKQTKQGIVQAVTVETGNRLATLPAANFSGQGNALVTGMTKGELSSAAKQQEAQNSNAAPAKSNKRSANKEKTSER
jgi:hypothetical protein